MAHFDLPERERRFGVFSACMIAIAIIGTIFTLMQSGDKPQPNPEAQITFHPE